MPDSTTDAATLAVVVARLDDLRTQVSGLSAQIQHQNDTYVPRREWELWRDNANRELDDIRLQGAQATAGARADAASAIAELRTHVVELEQANEVRHVSWPSVAAAVCAIAALGLSILTRVSP